MCLAVPAKILKISEDGLRAWIDHRGVRGWAGISLVPGVRQGDYILLHAGEAIQALDEGEAHQTLMLWEKIYAADR